MKTLFQTGIAGAAVACLLLAQTEFRRATIKGQSGDQGKCTVEVVVDTAAEVWIRGDSGQLRTLGGQPAQWRRMECTGPLTSNPSDFKFTGVDGRGRQTLVSDPRQNRGVAVIRIEDPKGGTEGYTFEIEWRGGTLQPDSIPLSSGGGLPSPYTDACRDAVRSRALRDFGYQDLLFGNIATDRTPGRSDWIVGTFDTRGIRRDSFQFSCWMDSRTGQVKSVDVTRSGGAGVFRGGGYTGQSAVQPCQDAVSARAQRDGYSDIRVRWADSDTRPGRQDRVEGSLSARGRDGNNSFLDFTCSIDSRNGQVRTVDLRQR